MKIVHIKNESGFNSISKEKTNYAVYLSGGDINTLWSRHIEEMDAELEAKYLRAYVYGIDIAKPFLNFYGTKSNGFSEVGAKIELSKLRKGYPKYTLTIKQIVNTNRFYISGKITDANYACCFCGDFMEKDFCDHNCHAHV